MSKLVPLERTLTRSILRYLNGLDRCRAIKRHGNALLGGEPDIHGCYRGRALELEVKRPGKHATPRQEAALRKWETAGAIAGVVRSVDDMKRLLERADKEERTDG